MTEPITPVTPVEAGARSTDLYALTPEQATQKLATMAKELNSFTAGTTQAQPTMERFLSDQQADAERRDAERLVDYLNSAGLPPTANSVGLEVREYIEGKRGVSPELRAAVEGKIKAWGHDPEFSRRLFSGDAEAGRLFKTAVGMLVAPIKETSQ